jgi:transposase
VEKNSLQDLSRDDLIALIVELRHEMATLREENAALKTEVAKLRKNSSNSSKPPSSDITKPPRQNPSGGTRKIGGQPGHDRHEREPFPPAQVDRVENHVPNVCPDCGGKVRRAASPAFIQQQVELVEKPFVVIEHRAYDCQCSACGRRVFATLPEEIERAGLFGENLTAMVGWLKSRGHMSYTGIAEFLRDGFALPVSRGFLVKVAQKTSAALAAPYETLERALADEAHLNVDETGHPGGKKDFWAWVYRAESFSFFRIVPTRSSRELERLLGRRFKGILTCDYFSAYRKFLRLWDVAVQFCLAHLVRDVKFVAGLPDKATSRYGGNLLTGLRRLFRIWHRRETMAKDEFIRMMEKARDEFLATVRRAPFRIEAQNLEKRFRNHAKEYFRFVTTSGVEPTNNAAEQVLRPMVMDRRMTQGTRSEKGRRWCERIWTASATCQQQHRSFFAYLRDAVQANFRNLPAPPLLASGA